MGLATAIIGSAVIGAGASLAASSSSKKATSKAVNAQVQSNRESLALQREIYDRNAGVLRPYVEQGNRATGVLSGLLNVGGDPAASRAAFDTYRGSTGYDFRLGEGMRALNTGFAGRGVLNSGAATKAAIGYGQNTASDEFARYMAALTGQQQVGMGAASALAGVGQTFASNATNINTSTGSAIGNGALARASINGQFMNNIAGITGNAIGALSSYGQWGRTPGFGGGAWGVAGSDGIY